MLPELSLISDFVFDSITWFFLSKNIFCEVIENFLLSSIIFIFLLAIKVDKLLLYISSSASTDIAGSKK